VGRYKSGLRLAVCSPPMVRSDLRSLRGIRIASDIVVAELNDDLPAFIRAMDDMVALQEPAVVLDALGKIAADLARDLAQASADSRYTLTHPELDLRRVARGQVVEKAQALELSNAIPQRPNYR
jgi:hypothetical protein